MPWQSFDNAQAAAGNASKPYVPLAARQSPWAGNPDPTANQSAPAKAPAAPKGTGAQKAYNGLCDALNQHQQELVKAGVYSYADTYNIKFNPASLSDATIKKPGGTVQGQSPMPAPTTANDKANPNTNSMNTTAANTQVFAGMQIVQFIEMTMRNSSYINDQLTAQPDPVTGKPKPNSNSGQNQQAAWFKISVNAVPNSEMDPKRNDYAYDFTFIITPYGINEMQSEWFTTSRYRGSHKSYNYWFTGQNNAVLDFSVEYNNLYSIVLSNSFQSPGIQSATSDARVLARRSFQTRSGESDQGGGIASEPNANGADFLYNPFTFTEARVKIVGDPAWLQQGEAASQLTAETFNFNPFNADGTINFEAQEVVFDINWNRPQDYDLNTGLMNVTAKNTGENQPQENATFIVKEVMSSFVRGKFEQEIIAKSPLVDFGNKTPGVDEARTTSAPAAPSTTQNRTPSLADRNGMNAWLAKNGGTPTTPGQGYSPLADRNGTNAWLAKNGGGSNNPTPTTNSSSPASDANPPSTPLNDNGPPPPTSDGKSVEPTAEQAKAPPPKVGTNSTGRVLSYDQLIKQNKAARENGAVINSTDKQSGPKDQ